MIRQNNPMSLAMAAMARRLADLERRVAGAMQPGPVAAVDPERQRVRLQIGVDADGTPQLGPWIPYAQTAGALKVHTPPSVGQTMMAMAPGGDPEQAVAVPYTWSDANGSPSAKGDEHVMTFGDATVELRGGEIVVTVPRILLRCGGSTFELTGAGLALVADSVGIEGSSLTHNGKNVGHDHRHRDVMPGPSLTGTPA